jgi:serine phosphatase RsbU (regulator of sigma subunit)/PAS domain-containing protein/anti-sigma regulatory factor (Ser/Thr protein kinase)
LPSVVARWLRRWAWPAAFGLPLLAALPGALTYDQVHFLVPAAWLLASVVAVQLVAPIVPGAVAGGWSLLIAWFAFTEPRWTLALHERGDAGPLAAYAALVIVVVAVIQGLRRASAQVVNDFDQLEDLLSNAPLGMGFLDHDLRLVQVNAAFADLVETERASLLGRTVDDIVPESAGVAERVLRSGVGAYEIVVGVGEPTRRLSLGYYPIRPAGDGVTGVGLVVRDVTTQAEAEATRVELLQRLQRLQRITASLAAARTLDEVVRVVVTDIRQAVGASAASMLTVEGNDLVMVGHDGYEAGLMTQWARFPINTDTPLGVAVSRASFVHVPNLEEMRTLWPALPALIVRTREQGAVSAVPLVDHGRVTGAIGLSYDIDRDIDVAEEGFLVAMATQCAQALVRARLYESEHAARRTSEESAIRLSFLAEASAALTQTLDVETTIRHLVALAVPRLADWCAVHLTSATGEHIDVERRARSGLAPRHVLGQDVELLVQEVSRTRHLVQEMEGDDGPGRWLSLPLVAQDRLVGVLTLADEGDRRLGADDAALALELGNRMAQAVLNARLFGERAHVARTLQASLLPPVMPTLPGLDLASRFYAVGEGIDVGGDFFDVFRLGRPHAPSDRWALVIGDVRGKGAEAAAITGAARHTIRAAGLHLDSPAALLRELNEVLLVLSADGAEVEAPFCTAIVGVVEPREGRVHVTLAVGGHPLPIHLMADGTTGTAGRSGDLLGVLADPELQDVELVLGPGDALVLFTDGITERHTGDQFLDDEGLAAVVSRCAGFTAAALAERVETAARAFVEEAPRDDMAVLVLRVPEARPAVAAATSTDLSGDVTAPARARHFIAAALAGGTTDRPLVETAILLASELVTNAVVHAEGTVRIGLERSPGRVRVTVGDTSTAEPQLRHAPQDSPSGRGIYLVDQLADRWGVDVHGDGKTVWFELRTSR